MAFFEFPNARTFDSDLTWIIDTIKELLDQCGSLTEAWEKFKEEFQEQLSDTVMDILEGWLDDGTLANLIQSWIDHQPWLNVKDYGALGNGVHDDAPAIQTAINAASETIGTWTYMASIVYLPKGVYRINSPLTLPANVVLQGEGINNTVIFNQGSITNTAMIKTANYDTFVDEGSHAKWLDTKGVPCNCGFNNLTIHGNYWNATGESTVAMYAYGIDIHDVQFYGCYGWALYLTWGDGDGDTWNLNRTKITENYLRNVHFFACTQGIYQDKNVNDSYYDAIYMGRFDGMYASIKGTSYWTYAHFFDGFRDSTKTGNYAFSMSAQGQFKGVIESTHNKRAAIFNGYFQNIECEMYNNEYGDVQLGGSYSTYDFVINCKYTKNANSFYISSGSNNRYHVNLGGLTSNVLFSAPVSNSIFEITSNGSVQLAQGGAFTNCTGNAIGSTVSAGSGVDNVWYPGKP